MTVEQLQKYVFKKMCHVINIYLCIQNTDKKIIFGYWSSFLPDHPAIPGMAYGQNIFTSILKDPVPQVGF